MMFAILISPVLFQQSSSAPQGLPFLSPIFNDHMVMQRDRANTFWGWTAPGTRVQVAVAGNRGSGTADSSGKWVAKVSPPPTGGPYTVTIDGPTHVELKDVLVGDVWVCSGQSNMEFGISNANNAKAEVANANYPNIRLAMVSRDTQFDARAVTSAPWLVCSPETVVQKGWGGFSAVAYFFGRELNQRLKVPIGLIQDCWGGTPVEAWISRPMVENQGDFSKFLASIDKAKREHSTEYGKKIEDWLARVDPGSRFGAGWENEGFDDSGWKTTASPTNYEALGLADFPEVVWFRGEVDLPSNLPSGDATLSLGQVDDIDTTWINGLRVGSTYQYDTPRSYSIHSGILKPGKNLVAIRVLNTGSFGGFTWSPENLYLKLGDGTKVALTSTGWRYATGANIWANPPIPQPLENNPNVPTVLYNGMIAPIVPFAIKGALWYQGETNAGRAYQYRTLLPDMIADWRHAWGEGNFPFFVVQLANWQARATDPGDSDWAELREAQAMTARDVPNAGLATAADIGDTQDIHPKNKQDVGLRLALAALHVAYGQDLSYAGPTYKSFRKDGSGIRVEFDHADKGLTAKAGALGGFSIAGADHKFYWADARIDGNSVVVSSAQVKDPVAVRYGWANNPLLTLYNGTGLPAIPFRTDDWPGVTKGRK